MSPLEIILLAGVAGLWTAVLLLVVTAFRLQGGIARLEASLERMQRDMSSLLPRLGSTLESFERSGHEVARAAGSVSSALDRLAPAGSGDGLLRWLPVVFGAARTVLPLLLRRRR
jgi:hypothetical protein